MNCDINFNLGKNMQHRLRKDNIDLSKDIIC